MIECSPHAWSFKERDSYCFDWHKSNEFTAIEKCDECKKERHATYRLVKVDGEFIY